MQVIRSARSWVGAGIPPQSNDGLCTAGIASKHFLLAASLVKTECASSSLRLSTLDSTDPMQFNIFKFALFAAPSLLATRLALASPATVELHARANVCIYVPASSNGCPAGIVPYICGSSAGQVYCCNNPDCLNDESDTVRVTAV
uniref:Extracellular membrane protein CFEM domain-containing protein n=1 Tax=Mycena chlorophos TaxID=658473 RepID=A0ABQ0LT18_MYCCL|nr:predicted protein [Mycena chlorophos]